MRPEDYDEYAGVIDWFSHPALYPTGQRFIELVADHLPSKARVADVGGGTGAFADDLLLLRRDLHLSILEPSEAMAAIAAERLEGRADISVITLDDALPTLPQQDAFLFIRSLYAMRPNLESYTPFLRGLISHLTPGGLVCISEVTTPGDPSEQVEFLRDNLSAEDPERFERNLPVLIRAMERFNEGVNSGEFVRFEPDTLDAVMTNAGFGRIAGEGLNGIFRAPGAPRKRGLLKSLLG